MAESLLAETDDCGRAALRLISRGHAVVAELQRVADASPPAFTGVGHEAQRFSPVVKDFTVFRTEGAVERLATTPELIELDDEHRELHEDAAHRLFRLLAAISKYASDLARYLADLEAGVYIDRSLDSMARDTDGAQLLTESIGLLGTMLLLLDDRIPGPVRERGLVAFYRFTVGTSEAADEFPDICRLFKSTSRPADADFAKRPAGYPENFFARFPLPHEAVRVVVGLLQTGDVYCQAQHYPLPEHRSHSLAAQAGLLYVILFFDVRTLESDVVAMREIVNRHFGDVWVVAFALGFTADLLAMWAPYAAAREALAAAITAQTVQHLEHKHCEKLASTQKQLAEYLTHGTLTEDFVMENTNALLSCLRQANTSIRWLLLQPTTSDPKLKAIFDKSTKFKEQVLAALVDTALLEDRVRGLLVPLVARRDTDWAEQKAAASEKMDDLAVYFSGEHALQRKVKDEELEQWFRGLQQRISELGYSSPEEKLALGRKISQLLRALEEVEHFHQISRQPQILHFLSDTRALLQRMVRTVNLREELLQTIATVADLSYAWKALGAYEQTMQALLAKSPGSVKGLRALFLKLASILEAPLRRARQAQLEAYQELVAEYYSERLVAFMRSVLQEIPRLIFGLLAKISQQKAARLPEPLPSRFGIDELQVYAEQSSDACDAVSSHMQQIAFLMRGIRETDVAVLGTLRLEPRAVLVDGLRFELARQIEALLGGLVFSASGRGPSKSDVETPLIALATQAKSLSRAFEHVQDYVGVSALEMWHQEFGRVIRFLLHMEQHALLRRRLPPVAVSPHHVADCPIAFPDNAAASSDNAKAGSGKPVIGKSFIARTVSMLLAVTDTRSTVGGLYGEWRNPATGEMILDGMSFDVLYQALGAPGLAAVSRLLGLRTAGQLRKVFYRLPAEISEDTRTLLCDAASRAQAGGSDAARGLKVAAQRTANLHGPLLELLSLVGQHQLLRRRIHCTLRQQAKLDAALATDALGTLDAAELAEDASIAQEVVDSELPNVFDFIGDGGTSPDVLLAKFHARLSRAAELPGFSDPLRQIYVTVQEGNILKGFDVLLALALVSLCGSTKVKQKKGSKEPTAAPRCADANAALLTGTATLLQQLPRSYKDGTLELLAAHVVGSFCVDGAESRDGIVGESARIVELCGELLELLGLPREQFAEFAPRGLLDLLPPE